MPSRNEDTWLRVIGVEPSKPRTETPIPWSGRGRLPQPPRRASTVAQWPQGLAARLFAAVAVTGIAGAAAFAQETPTTTPAASPAVRPQLAVTLEEDGATVTVGDEVFTRYLIRSGNRPVLWPINGPTGLPVTRTYPVSAAAKGEERDHPHHRSLWFGYEGVNGCDFWHGPEPGVTRRYEIGSQRHREFLRADSDGRTAVIAARTDWLSASGRAVAHDERLFEFGVERDGARWIDCRIRLWSARGPLELGDTKEGAFAMRVASPMRVEAGRGGRIVSSRGEADAAMWGHEAEWVDYHGPLSFDAASDAGNEIVGVAIMSHPTSYHPTPRWHVRPYGLHSANPFGEGAYTDDAGYRGSKNGTNPTGAAGGVKLAEGESLRLRYRVLLHRGDEQQGDVAGAFAKFAKAK